MPSWLIYSLLSAVFAALVTIFGKIGLSNIDATLATAVRSVIMAIFLVIVVIIQGKWEGLGDLLSNKKGFSFIVLSGLAGALSWLCYFLAIHVGGISKVAPIDKLSVVFAVAFAGGTLMVPLG